MWGLLGNGTSILPAEVGPMLNKISSQEVILAVLVLIVSASLFIISLRFTYKLLIRRDEVISALGGEIGKMVLCLTNVIKVQELDHAATVVNRDLLQGARESLQKLELCLSLVGDGVKEHTVALKQVARDCAAKNGRG